MVGSDTCFLKESECVSLKVATNNSFRDKARCIFSESECTRCTESSQQRKPEKKGKMSFI